MKQKNGGGDSGSLYLPGIKGLAILIAIVVAIVAVSISVSDDATEKTSSDETPVFEPSEYIHVELEETDCLSGEVTESDGRTVIRVALSDDAKSGFGLFAWYIKQSGSDSFLSYFCNSFPYETWILDGDEEGDYTISVVCMTSFDSILHPGGFGPGFIPPNSKTYTMNVSVTKTGEVDRTVSWTYDGRTYKTEISYDYSEYRKYSGESASSYSERSSFDSVSNFIVVNDVISDLAADLSSEYESTYGTEATGQGFAEFVLGFVQSGFSYSYDWLLYKHTEYYAFPMETIHNQKGDCEDTSILYASLMKASGYSAGVFMIPGHCIGAIALDEYTAGKIDQECVGKVSLFSYRSPDDGKTYYGCETTLEECIYGVGWISDTYSIDESGEIGYTTTDVFGRKTTSTGDANGTYRSQGYGLRIASARSFRSGPDNEVYRRPIALTVHHGRSYRGKRSQGP